LNETGDAFEESVFINNPPNILLIPTLDIEIIWQTHLLRPEMY
jgi:hypothetical protein